MAPLALQLLECCVRAALMLGFLLFVPSPALGQRQQAKDEANCQLEPGGESTVLAIAGPQTLRLADGRLIQLAEILTPSAVGRAGFDPSSDAVAYLRLTALGRKVEVKFGGSHRDRYGVTIAHIFVAGEPPLWLQEGLVSAGLALAFPQADNHACSPQLASLEEEARNKKRGYWGLALFKVLPAHDTRAFLNLMQTYQIVEGEVTSMTHAGGRTIIHFTDSKASFIVTIEPAAQKKITEQDLSAWQGQRIRIRGWVERKRGPTITINQPEQIELLRQQPSESGRQKNDDE